MHSEISRRFQEMRLDTIDVIEFLVIRRPAPEGLTGVRTLKEELIPWK